MEDVKKPDDESAAATEQGIVTNQTSAPEVPLQTPMPAPVQPAAVNGFTPMPTAEWQATPPPQKRSWRRCFAYLPEYLVMLVMLVTVVSAITALVGIGIDSLVKSEKVSSSSLYGSYTQNFDSFQLVASLSALVIALPVFMVLFLRTKTAEAEMPAVKTHRWRKGFLATFLVVEGLAAIWTLIDLAYDLIGRAIGNDGGLFSFFSSGSKDPWWQGLIVALINVAILVYVIFVMSRDYKTEQGQ